MVALGRENAGLVCELIPRVMSGGDDLRTYGHEGCLAILWRNLWPLKEILLPPLCSSAPDTVPNMPSPR